MGIEEIKRKATEEIRSSAVALTNAIIKMKDEGIVDMTEEIHQYMDEKLNPEGKDVY